MSPTYAAARVAFDGVTTLDASLLDRVLSEKAWSQIVCEYAALNRWLVYRTWRSIHSPAGYPDLTLVRGARLVIAELKTERGRLSPAQKTWLERLGAVPGIEVYGPWRPSQWPDVRDTLL